MENNIGINENDIVLLLDNFGLDSQLLWKSFLQTGYRCVFLVTSEESFLPEGVVSVYDSFHGDYQEGQERKQNPRYFNEVVVPKEWRISENGKIFYLNEQRGKLHYAEPVSKRYVKAVDWYDKKGIKRITEYYNIFGEICSRKIYDSNEKSISRSWFSATGEETIVQNYVTGTIILNDESKTRIFRSKIDFICYFLMKMGYDKSKIFINSLSIPFFVSENLNAPFEKRDVLFWQEPVREEIPGNMQVILRNQSNRVTKIIVQKKESYDKLLSLGADKAMVHKLGYIYSFNRENHHRPNALICTNSDCIEHCREMIEALPEMQFHIAALTNMSHKLMNLASYENVILYPNVQTNIIDYLFGISDYYLDINYGAEIVSAVRRAFFCNQLIFAFQKTVHNREFVADEHIYMVENFEKMVISIKEILTNKNLLDGHLKRQHEVAMAVDNKTFIRIIEELFN